MKSVVGESRPYNGVCVAIVNQGLRDESKAGLKSVKKVLQ